MLFVERTSYGYTSVESLKCAETERLSRVTRCEREDTR